MTIGIALANDSELVIRGLAAMLAPFAPRVRVTGTATGDPDITALPDDDVPIDVLLLDTFARADGGLDAAAMLLSQAPSFRVVIYTDSSAERHVLKALRLGVHGYVLKSTPAPALVEALEKVHAGEVVVSGDLATRAARLAAAPAADEPWPGSRFGLTPRESEVLVLAAEGRSGLEIAQKLSIGHETVRSHFKHVYQKLGVSDRTAAVAIAWQEGIAVREPVNGA